MPKKIFRPQNLGIKSLTLDLEQTIVASQTAQRRCEVGHTATFQMGNGASMLTKPVLGQGDISIEQRFWANTGVVREERAQSRLPSNAY